MSFLVLGLRVWGQGLTIVSKLWLISKEAENIQVTVSVAVEKVICFFSPGPRLFSCLSRIFREMGVKRLVHVQKSHSEPQI